MQSSIIKSAIKQFGDQIYDLATKFFPLVASWLLNEKVNFEPWSLKRHTKAIYTTAEIDADLSRKIMGLIFAGLFKGQLTLTQG